MLEGDGLMTIQLTTQDIIWLFDEVWSRMEYAPIHRDKCLDRLKIINSLFRQCSNINELLRALDTVEDIGLVIASGLIFTTNREAMVPFDKYTMGWALELKIIPDNKISRNDNYTDYSKKVHAYIQTREDLHSMLDFVREADDRCQFPLSPE
jgi:hypothetical protein